MAFADSIDLSNVKQYAYDSIDLSNVKQYAYNSIDLSNVKQYAYDDPHYFRLSIDEIA